MFSVSWIGLWFTLPLLLCTDYSASYSSAHDFVQAHCAHGYISDYKQTEFICYCGPQSLLEYLLYPLSIHEFINEYFDRRPLHISRDNKLEYYSSLNIMNSYQDILKYLDTRSDIAQPNGLRTYPEVFIGIYDSGKDQHIQPFRIDQNKNYLATLSQDELNSIKQYHQQLNNQLGPWDLGAIEYMQQNNYTIKMFQLEYHLIPLRQLVNTLSNQIGFAVRSNMYITPAFNKGYEAHYDMEEAWILQINNTKNWRIYNDLYHYCSQANFSFADKSDLCLKNIISELSTSAYDQLRNVVKQGNAIMEFELKPGDFLYVPRGWIHEADVLNHNKFSIHITIGVYLELFNDYLFQFIRWLFAIPDAKKIFKTIFYAKNVRNSVDIKKIRKCLLNELEPWLRTISFRDEALRESVPLFYQFGVMEGNNWLKIMKLFEKYFFLFMQYTYEQNSNLNTGIYGDQFGRYMQRFTELFKDNNLKTKLKKKLMLHYAKTVSSFKGVYNPKRKDIYKSYKRISGLMREPSVRYQLRNLIW